MKRFETYSSPRRKLMIVLRTWFVLTMLALLGRYVSEGFWFCLEICILVISLGCAFLASRARWKIVFEGRLLTLTDMGLRSQYRFDSLALDDFLFHQGALQRRKNTGDIAIRNTLFALDDVERFSQLKQYLEDTFKET